MALSINLGYYKKKLSESLGDLFSSYLANMKLWFHHKMTKEEFDFESRKLLNSDTIRYHNEFMLALLNKCNIQASQVNKSPLNSQSHSNIKDKLKKSCLKKKSKQMKGNLEHRVKPEFPLNHAPRLISRDAAEDSKIAFCTKEYTLPDINMIYGRMFVIAWDCGLDTVEPEAVKFLMIAIEMHLKSLLLEIFSQRKSYRLREGSFRHSLNSKALIPYLANSTSFTESSDLSETTTFLSNCDHVPCYPVPYDIAEGSAAHELSCCTEVSSPYQPVSLLHVYNTLKVKKDIIPSHTVYAINMERISVRLSHPSHEELQQDSIHQQEKKLREILKLKQPIA